ncbi:dephospho-CoA kinase [Campylobacter novaezeelandiae]|uniref:Dephospho-CoA kinase n=1 Tax=Campylobacter novaezeelandiae TaxID=2267891 RepID=A0A4Q9JUC5_9BACT|nr:dephospho-CoA kinase [Campylobacter novaezeelandiae]MBK1964470.1 dephospho-CoA kinase [Campylobacter novaezeelandiae]MBK1993564.1 dephospho-CoA kinase [Campylobacter novaezeelandiae]QWU79651.1 dephospho-CoA kinase [Campylobacter novaezeelandiae]TBR81254.1 dephospho-CoA kinase [Campylobacter novaezeelandiae]TBR82572.1 dephospho-CoA kinase [Campylobacter novaezeelandiae]
MKNAFFVTASIACGKSSFIKIANSMGFKSISADKIAHQILDSFSKELIEIFSPFNTDKLNLINDHKIDRKNLGKIIFSNPQAKKILEDFTHPKIRIKILEQMQILEQENKPFFIEIPLFFESGAYKNLGKVILIYTSKELSLKRLMQRDNLNKEEALKRINALMDIEKKVSLADFVITNESSYEIFQKKSIKFIEKLSKETNEIL